MRSLVRRNIFRLAGWVLLLVFFGTAVLPLAIGTAYGVEEDLAQHILTYTENKLTWDEATDIDENGAAKLSLFKAVYDGALSENGENIIAPGIANSNKISLRNTVEGSIQFTAVLYFLSTNEDLNVGIEVRGEGLTATEEYLLPEGVDAADVISVATGEIAGGAEKTFDVSWLWEFYTDEAGDALDTMLGNMDDLDDVTVGLYIVVEDDGTYTEPDVPKTGDGFNLGWYILLAGVSAAGIILLLVSRKREKKCEG